ncbi:hypothetical protein Lal_00008591 [Lupinus albus]|nr:hypothetical protein Lal_00008591 [Lupinus albus]
MNGESLNCYKHIWNLGPYNVPHVDLTGQDENPTYDLPPRDTLNRTMNYNNPQAAPKINRNAPQDPPYQEKGELELIKERHKVIEGTTFPNLKNTFEMCLVSDVVLPPKFKNPKYKKYNSTSYLMSHLHMYIRNMTTYDGNDKLSNGFLKQYKYKEDVAPVRSQLQGMSKKSKESFKDTQR